MFGVSVCGDDTDEYEKYELWYTNKIVDYPFLIAGVVLAICILLSATAFLIPSFNVNTSQVNFRILKNEAAELWDGFNYAHDLVARPRLLLNVSKSNVLIKETSS